MGAGYGIVDGSMQTLLHRQSLGASGFGRLMWQHSKSFATLAWLYNGSKVIIDHSTKSQGMLNSLGASTITGAVVGYRSGQAMNPSAPFPSMGKSVAEYLGFAMLSEVLLSEGTVLNDRLPEKVNQSWADMLWKVRTPMRKLRARAEAREE